MNIGKMLAELRAERENLEQAIITLQRFAWQTPRPPARLDDSGEASGRPLGS
jgi:hypothetical protein